MRRILAKVFVVFILRCGAMAGAARGIHSITSLVVFASSFVDDAATAALPALGHAEDASASKLKELSEKRRALAVERSENKRELRNESRKRKRLLSKVSRCSVEELMNAVVIKSTAQAKAKAKAEP